MLVLSLKINEHVTLHTPAGSFTIAITSVQTRDPETSRLIEPKVKLGIQAPADWEIRR